MANHYKGARLWPGVKDITLKYNIMSLYCHHSTVSQSGLKTFFSVLCFLVSWIKTRFCKNAQLGGFGDFDGFSVIRMSTASAGWILGIYTSNKYKIPHFHC